jgi:hypothetical protein
MSLYSRLTSTGTLSEPSGVPDPLFALPSTVNRMHALARLVDHHRIDATTAKVFYASVSRRAADPREENTILEQLLFALHQCCALHALRRVPRKADVARVAIVSWYYGVYAAASAMVAAQDGSFQDDHTATAGVWDRQIASRGLIMKPFDLRVTTLLKKNADAELAALLTVPRFKLAGTAPQTPDEALGACIAYLSGSADWWRWKTEEDVRGSRDFRALGVSDFRTSVAREIRDKRLTGRSIGFLHEAFRYRGKANYREALYLGYGTSIEPLLSIYVDDLSKALDAFVVVAGIFCSRRLGPSVWSEFTEDLEAKRAFSLSPSSLWN